MMLRMDDRKRSARAVVARRGELGMTQQALSDRSGVPIKTISNLESRARWPIARNRARLEAALGWPVGELDRLREAPADDRTTKTISPQLRKLIRQELDDPADQRRVIGLLEGTLTWPDEGREEDSQYEDGKRPRVG